MRHRAGRLGDHVELVISASRSPSRCPTRSRCTPAEARRARPRAVLTPAELFALGHALLDAAADGFGHFVPADEVFGLDLAPPSVPRAIDEVGVAVWVDAGRAQTTPDAQRRRGAADRRRARPGRRRRGRLRPGRPRAQPVAHVRDGAARRTCRRGGHVDALLAVYLSNQVLAVTEGSSGEAGLRPRHARAGSVDVGARPRPPHRRPPPARRRRVRRRARLARPQSR